VACVSGPLEKYGFLPNIQNGSSACSAGSLREDVRPGRGTGVME